jgi:hypothetical protein
MGLHFQWGRRNTLPKINSDKGWDVLLLLVAEYTGSGIHGDFVWRDSSAILPANR